MIQRSFRWLIVTIAILGFCGDQAGKYLVFRSLHTNESLHGDYDLIRGVFRLHVDFDPDSPLKNDTCLLVTWNGKVRPAVNHGALYGLGREHKKLANSFFAIISILAVAAICWWGSRPTTKSDRFLCLCLGLILGGTFGNLYDRLVFGGVRDFLYFYLTEFPVFNIADSCLVCGAGLLLFHAVFLQKQPAVSEDPNSGSSSPVAEPIGTALK